MKTSKEMIAEKMDAMIAKRNANRRDNRPELTEAQIEAQRKAEPTTEQTKTLRQFKVPEADIAKMSKYDASEALDAIFAEIARRNALPISKALKEALVKWDFELADVEGLTQGEGRTLLQKVAPPLKRDENATYVSKNPLWKAAKKSKRA